MRIVDKAEWVLTRQADGCRLWRDLSAWPACYGRLLSCQCFKGGIFGWKDERGSGGAGAEQRVGYGGSAQRVDSRSSGRGLEWQGHGPSRVICGEQARGHGCMTVEEEKTWLHGASSTHACMAAKAAGVGRDKTQ